MNKILRYQYYKNITENYQHKLVIRYYFSLIDEEMLNTPEEESETQIIFIDVDISETQAATWNFINDSSYSDDLIKVLFEYGKRELIKNIETESVEEQNTYCIRSNTHKELNCPFNPNKIKMIKDQIIRVSVPSKTSEANIDESSSNQSQENPDAMTDKKHEQKTPSVFISYSHDSEEHKNWVRALAEQLLDNGVEVLLDQWGLKLGDDLYKYMERSVKIVERVLVICTKSYVIKANEGKGGVGYEAMIVTGELVKDLGTNKFIPVMRENNPNPELPASLSTRYYIDLSNDNYEKGFEKLLRELHGEPALKKPPIGKNPFIKGSTSINLKNQESEVNSDKVVKVDDYLLNHYKTAATLIRKMDFNEWQLSIIKLKKEIPDKLSSWQNKFDKNHPNTQEELIDIDIEGLEIYIPVIFYSLAGILSRKDQFKDQVEMLDYIAASGRSQSNVYNTDVKLPFTVGFAYQALHGASCIASSQLDIAINFIKTPIKLPNDIAAKPIYQQWELVGWAPTLAKSSELSFNYLTSLSQKISSLNSIFGNDDELKILICSYYMLLNYFDFLIKIKTNEEEMINGNDLQFYFPLNFTRVSDNIGDKAYIKLNKNKKELKEITSTMNISDIKIINLWPYWINHCERICKKQFGLIPRRYTLFHENLVKDVYE